jgi:hypothetical protein
MGGKLYATIGFNSAGVFTYVWMPTSGCFGSGTVCNTAYQTISVSSVTDISAFTAASGGTYLVVGRSVAGSNIYKWISAGSNCPMSGTGPGWGDGTRCSGFFNQITAIIGPISTFSTTTAVGPQDDIFAAVSGLTTVSGLTYTATPFIYRYSASQNCFGNGGGQCGSVGQYANQIFPSLSSVNDMQTFTLPNGEAYAVIASNNGPTAQFFTLVHPQRSGATIPGCKVYKHNSMGTTTFASGDSNTGISTGPLTETTDYTLSCRMVDGTTQNTLRLTIIAGSVLPTVTIAGVTNASEPSTNGSFRFHVDTAPSSNLTINYTVSGSASATTSPDYTALSGTATILAGQTDSAVIPVSINDDLLFEGTETVKINVTSSANYTGTPTATINITDDETSASLPSGLFTVCFGTAGPACTLGVSPSRVRKGVPNAATITWYVAGLVAGEHGNSGDTCQIVATPAVPNFPQSSLVGATNWINTVGVRTTLNQQTVFRLTCTAPDGVTKKTIAGSIGLIPAILEI